MKRHTHCDMSFFNTKSRGSTRLAGLLCGVSGESAYLAYNSIGQTPVFQKDLTEKYLFAIILLELLIYLLDLGGLSLWIRKLLIMSRQAVKIH